jgi:hypothetical protein
MPRHALRHALAQRIDNEEFFPTPSPLPAWVVARRSWFIAEDEFYDAPRPPVEASWLARAAAHPMRFGAILFAVGWAGILLQLGFFRQLVVGAPLFEELAKFGPPLMLVALLRARTLWARLPWAWASGAAFGVFEHYSTYPDESLVIFGERIAFHAGATGLSMALFTVVEHLPDVRARWMSTLAASIIHWGNNFGALVFALFTVFLPVMSDVALFWAFSMTVLTYVLTFAVSVAPEGSRRRFAGVAEVLLPRLGAAHAHEAPLTPAQEETATATAAPPLPPTTSDEAEAAEAPRTGPDEAPR